MRRHISALIRRRTVLVNFAVQHGNLARGIAHDGIMGRGDTVKNVDSNHAAVPATPQRFESRFAGSSASNTGSVTIARAIATLSARAAGQFTGRWRPNHLKPQTL